MHAIQARHALGLCGRMMHKSASGAYTRSEDVERIDEFWSHSWHCGWLEKVTTLWLYYNGVPSALAGLLVALLSGIFAKSLELDGDELSLAAKAAAALSAVVGLCTVTLWPSRHRVFLDKACIPQDDQAAKQAGILSLGFILRNSKTMLCLWDDTYLSRLWCIFEYAARLYLSSEDYPGDVVVLPTYYGPLAFYIGGCLFAYRLLSEVARLFGDLGGMFCNFVALLCCSTFFGHMLVKRTRAAESQKERLRGFSVASGECFCCKVGHRDPQSNEEMLCDRVLIERTIGEWFGGLDRFESYVVANLGEHLPSGTRMPYLYLVLASTPLGYWQLFWWVTEGDSRALAYGCYEVLLEAPLAWVVMLKVFSFFLQRHGGASRDADLPHWAVFLVSMAATLAVGASIGVQSVADGLLGFYPALGLTTALASIALASVYLPRGAWRRSFPWKPSKVSVAAPGR